MKVRGDIESVNLSTGQRWQRVSGDGESGLEPMRDHKYSGVAPACYGIRKTMKLEYVVVVPDEPGAGIRGFTDEVSIEIKDWMSDVETLRDATEHFREAIKEWYDGGSVATKAEFEEQQALIDKQMDVP